MTTNDIRFIVNDFPPRRHPKQARTCHKPRRAMLLWLVCLHCRRKLAQIDVIDGKTCIRFGAGYLTRMVLVCACGEVRSFKSANY